MAGYLWLLVLAGFTTAKAERTPNTKVLWPVSGAGELLAKQLEEESQNTHVRVIRGEER